LKRALPVERVYVMSLGSRQGNAHVHWHVAPLPPGVPYRDQQFRALMAEHGVLDIPDAEQRKLAAMIRAAIGHRL
jgi:diadenosine tetraphosphate (Ap4A) HIT family hydrolase